MGSHLPKRRLPIGAEIVAGTGVHFRVWAPRHDRVEVVLAGGDGSRRWSDAHALERERGGYFSGCVPEAGEGALYGFRLSGADRVYPDPASRFQPEGPHGPSQVVVPGRFAWSDDRWTGIPPEQRVLYELHVGTFTSEGTWTAAQTRLPELATLGVTVLEIMPVADFPGRFGWGYDGVNLFAPTRLYGAPDEFRRFVDRAHALGIGVILDVVYNHLGPDGNYLGFFSDSYFTDRYQTEWGWPFNFDGPGSGPVREYILANVRYWIDEFHLDGFRFDAIQTLFDSARGRDHIVAQIIRTARAATSDRLLYLVGEDEPQQAIHLRSSEDGGHDVDALWNDDWHHSSMVALTGRNEAYYSDYLGAPQEFVSAARYGFLYQGQFYEWQQKRRGTTAFDLPPSSFIHFLQNHDQIANSARGDRIHRLTSHAQLRAMTALLLLGPATPMLFMGQEFAASAPFLYFADHEPELAKAVEHGRREFLEQFPSLAQAPLRERLEQPHDPETFRRCKLDFSEREANAEVYALHLDLIRLRRQDATLRSQLPGYVDGAVLGGQSFVLRFFGGARGGWEDRLLLVNLGREMSFSPAPQPLLAPPEQGRWTVRWSSEDVKYGGLGHPPPERGNGRWCIPGQCAVLLTPASRSGT